MNKIQYILICIFALGFTNIQSQTTIVTLEDAIKTALKSSPDYQALLNRNQASYWRYRNFQANFLPQLRLSARPDFSNQIVTIPTADGFDQFAARNQTTLTSSLFISQNVPLTGGTFSVGSNFSQITVNDDIRGRFTNFNITPFSLNYSQNSLLYNPFRWDKKIEPLFFEEAKRDFIENMEDISISTCRRYFALLRAQFNLKIAKNNYSNQDTLFQIAKGRFKMGKIAENDLLQLEFSLLSAKNSVLANEVALKRTSQNLSRYLNLESEDIELGIPKDLALFEVTAEKAMAEAKNNRSSVIEFRRRRLEAEKEVARIKGNNRLNLSLDANFGLSQSDPIFREAIRDLFRTQGVSVTVGIPILDWGFSKSRRRLAEANLDLVNTNLKQEQQQFEQEINLHTLNWANQRNLLTTAKIAQEIAVKRYEISKKRYILGKITITDFNIAQQEKDQSLVSYINSLEKFWVDYYTLRRLTLYDFLKDKKIEVQDIIYD